MQLGRYIRLYCNGLRSNFIRRLAEHPLITCNLKSLEGRVCRAEIEGDALPGVDFMAAVHDVTGGMVSFPDWLERKYPQEVAKARNQGWPLFQPEAQCRQKEAS